jgi:hypothetical protein
MRTFIAGVFAVLGVAAATWMVFGPAIERWWKTPKPRPIEHVVVETELDVPNYSVMTSDEASLAQAVAQVEAAARDRSPDDALARNSLTSTDRADIAREVSLALRPLLAGSSEEYLAWVRSHGAVHPALSDPESDAARKAIAQWETIAEGFAASPVGVEGLRLRLRYRDGQGPFEAPEDEIRAGYSVSTGRFPDLPEDPKAGRLTIIEIIIPVMHIDRQTGVASNTLLGFWMARGKRNDAWRLWRIALYDFQRPSQAFVPVF